MPKNRVNLGNWALGSMATDNSTKSAEHNFDYVIVGGGSAGCTIASRLSESGQYNVCLLEAGGTHKSPLVTIPFNLAVTVSRGVKNWNFETTPQVGLNGRKGFQPRGKALGGSSSINAMIYIRGVKEDYDSWAALGNNGWSYDEVLPYFKKAEDHVAGETDIHGVGGPLTVSPVRSPNPLNDVFIRAAEEAQIPLNTDFNTGSQEGAGYYELTQRNGERCSAARAYLDPAEGRKNLTVLQNAYVERVILEGKKATGVQASIGNKSQRINAAREVIVCAGALQSPQVLLLSGIGAPDKLTPHGISVAHNLPGVGENLHDHPDYALLYKTSSSDAIGANTRSGLKIMWDSIQYKLRRRGMLTTNFNESGAFFYTDRSEPSPDIQLHFAISIVDSHGRKIHRYHGYTCHVCVLRPKSRGNLTLTNSDPQTHPQIDPAILAHDDDMETMLKGVMKAQQIMEGPAFDSIRGEPLYGSGLKDRDELIEDIRNRADTIYHPVGTCKMGQDDMAVVDEQLKVKGLDGLRVADASIMPIVISGNTNAPSIMIGEKCAAMILEEARAGQNPLSLAS
ncbi:MAG: GMC family oxidoreductase [Thalassospira sp.]|uniref:GMC family oxidoreductase n=1 Tax=Thalassospira sp. TaxID=1912094 RepID=UPI003A897B68